jgi:hypothetical protein
MLAHVDSTAMQPMEPPVWFGSYVPPLPIEVFLLVAAFSVLSAMIIFREQKRFSLAALYSLTATTSIFLLLSLLFNYFRFSGSFPHSLKFFFNYTILSLVAGYLFIWAPP